MKKVQNKLIALFAAPCVVAATLYILGEFGHVDMALLADVSDQTRFVVSTAIESDNADFAAAPQVPIFHRAFMLARACEQQGAILIGVAGSCGKTSVTGWIASALKTLGHRIVMIDGGYTQDFVIKNNAYLNQYQYLNFQ